eukprot:scaffold1982_cov93-Amphora_coffeaeformis.AAC.62
MTRKGIILLAKVPIQKEVIVGPLTLDSNVSYPYAEIPAHMICHTKVRRDNEVAALIYWNSQFKAPTITIINLTTSGGPRCGGGGATPLAYLSRVYYRHGNIGIIRIIRQDEYAEYQKWQTKISIENEILTLQTIHKNSYARGAINNLAVILVYLTDLSEQKFEPPYTSFSLMTDSPKLCSQGAVTPREWETGCTRRHNSQLLLSPSIASHAPYRTLRGTCGLSRNLCSFTDAIGEMLTFGFGNLTWGPQY